MSTHVICFEKEITQLYLQLSSTTHHLVPLDRAEIFLARRLDKADITLEGR